jgi:hypothetical protein
MVDVPGIYFIRESSCTRSRSARALKHYADEYLFSYQRILTISIYSPSIVYSS